MKKLLFHLFLFVMIICLFPQLTLARTGYVSDMLFLTFRQGPGNSYEVTKTLNSNTPVSILDEKNGFYKVKLQSEEIGWVDMKFIVFEPPKTIMMDQLNKENKTLENEISNLNATIQTLKDEISSLKENFFQKSQPLEASLKAALDEKIKMSDALSETRKDYNTLIEQSKNIEKVVTENKTLRENNSMLSKNLAVFKDKDKDIFKTGMIKWFFAGVGVLLLGWIIGQNVSSKKQRSGSSLLG